MNPLPPLHAMLRHDDRPFVYLNVAITADGKLAPANRGFVPFSSKHDQELLLTLRTRCDAVMAGARTVDAVPVNLGPGGKRFRDQRLRNGLAEYNLRVVVSGTASLQPDAEVFRHKFSPLIILVADSAPQSRIKALQKAGAIVKICGDKEVDFNRASKWLCKEWGVKRLLCEGGGEINGAMIAAGLVDEIYVTLCPVIFGGSTAPTMADGLGIAHLDAATKLKLRSAERIGAEMYLVYSVVR
jgi:2,5-diamino-6-(ribosylamino)-4(3H)-pyrimidinone 5'-phosphate reductase